MLRDILRPGRMSGIPTKGHLRVPRLVERTVSGPERSIRRLLAQPILSWALA
jgi:hypothetical protein